MSDATQALDPYLDALAVMVQDGRVIDAGTFRAAGAQLKEIAAYIDDVHAKLDPFVQNAHATWKAAVAERDKYLKPAEETRRILAQRMGAYEEKERAQARAAAEAARQQRQLAEAEATAHARAEEARLRKQAEDRRLAAAADLEAAGDPVAAEKLMEQPVVVPTVAPVAPPPAPLLLAPVPAVAGVGFRDQWGDFEVTNAAAVPREYWMLDEQKIRSVVRALREACAIPGIRVLPARRIPWTKRP